jgi:hypothetical protein
MHPTALSDQYGIDNKYSQITPINLSNVTPPLTLKSLQQTTTVNDLSLPYSDCALFLTPTKKKEANEYCQQNPRELEVPKSTEFPISKATISNANICAAYSLSPLYSSSIDSLSCGTPLNYISPIIKVNPLPTPIKKEFLSQVNGHNRKDNFKFYFHQDINEYANIEYKIEDSTYIKYNSKIVRLLLIMEYWSSWYLQRKTTCLFLS